MKPLYKMMVGLFLCAVIAFGAYQFALGLMEGIYSYRSPLQNDPPAAGQASGEPQARQVVFVLIDALRYDTSLKTEVMPVLNRIRVEGAAARMHSQPPSYSAPGYSVLLTGAWPYLSDGPAFNLAYEEIPTLTQDNLFSAAKRRGLTTAASGFHWFERLIPADALDAGFFTAGEDNAADEEVLAAALPWLGTDDYDLVLIHLDQVDYAGHYEGGPQDPNWDAAAARVDAMLGEILARLDLSEDILFICSDHGQIDAGGHGGHDAVTLVEPFLLAGKGILPGDYGEVYMVDVAPTLAALLGANLPASAQGRVLSEILVQPNEDLAMLGAVQQSRLLAKYSTAIGADLATYELAADPQRSTSDYQEVLEEARQARLRRERWPRTLVFVGALALTGLIAWRKRSQLTAWMAGGGLAYTLIFHLIYVVFGARLYSYSTVTGETALIVENGVSSIAALFTVWVLMYLRLGWRWLTRSQAAWRSLQLIFSAMGITALPLLVHIAWNGALNWWTLPALALHYLALLSLIQMLFLGIFGLILAGTAAVFAKPQPQHV